MAQDGVVEPDGTEYRNSRGGSVNKRSFDEREVLK